MSVLSAGNVKITLQTQSALQPGIGAMLPRQRRDTVSRRDGRQIGSLVMAAVFVLLFYGMGLFDFSFPSSANYDPPVVVERMQ